MEIKTVDIENPQGLNVVLGQSHFIKTVEDVYEALVSTVPGIKFGFAFCESSDRRLVRFTGTDDELIELSKKNALNISAGHSFILFLKDVYPINILKTLRTVPEIVGFYCATANQVKVIVAEDGEQRGILGVLDGMKPVGMEDEEAIKERKDFLRKIGYKL
ncbi:adenosine-specific kinase [candidate division WOR-3 bacterium]|nr:adenosine-specific kinase [candidate division WOR-3 bacterium]MCK4584263.1 adenosine-specific kinase [candidate division WOR-3 bacterium]